VYWNDASDASAAGIASAEHASADAAVPNCDNQFRIGYRVISALQRFFHVDRHGARNQEQICVAGLATNLIPSPSRL
jgi:hypothetical protein